MNEPIRPALKYLALRNFGLKLRVCADCPQALAISHKTLYDSKDALPTDLNKWLHHYKQERMRQGKIRWRRTPFETMIDGKEIWREKFGT